MEQGGSIEDVHTIDFDEIYRRFNELREGRKGLMK